MQAFCPNCGSTVGEQIGGKLALGLASAFLGSRVDPFLTVLLGLAGAWLGHMYIDTAIRRCPECGMVFRIAADSLI